MAVPSDQPGNQATSPPLFDGEVAVDTAPSDELFARIPAKRGVVLLSAEGGRPIVLLGAADMRARVRKRLQDPDAEERTKIPDLLAITRAVHWKRSTSHFEADLDYLRLAERFFPREAHRLVAWKPAVFVHVNLADPYPYFQRTREVFAAGGQYFGPFPSGRSAERFVEGLQDAFDLCRDVQCLRRAPNAPRCAYGQMGKCLAPCDGSISADDYRRTVENAVRFAGGDRRPLRDELRRRMQAAAATLRFEVAASLKARLDRLGEFDQSDYAHVRRGREFQYLAIEPGGTRQEARVFLVDRGTVDGPHALAYPPPPGPTDALLQRMGALGGEDRPVGPPERMRIGLLSQYLVSSTRRSGVLLHWEAAMTGAAVAGAVEAAADDLGLRPPRAKAKRDPGDGLGGT